MNKQTSHIVYITDQYESFKTLHTNRSVDPKHIRTIKDSIKENGVLINPILINSNMEVIDGQHRLEACKALNMPVYYLIVGDYGINEVQALNLNQKNWTRLDYAESFASMGYVEYQKLLFFSKEYDDFNFGSCIKLLQNSSAHQDITQKKARVNNNGEYYNMKQVFEEGTWEVSDYDKAVQWVNYIREVGKYYSGYNRSTFVNTMIALFRKPQFDIDELMRKLSYQSNALNDCSSVGDYLLLIEEIYNFKKRDKVSLKY